MSNILPFNPAFKAVLDFAQLRAIVALLESHPDQGAAAGVLAMISNQCGEEHDEADRERIALYQAAAQTEADDDLEVDDDAHVSMGADKGAFVQAWLWVPDAKAGIEETDDEEKENEDDRVEDDTAVPSAAKS